ncbi:hypothetical protein ACFMH7_004805 [Escherichia coli O8:H49]
MTDIVQMISGCDGKRFGAAYVECIFIFISVSVVKEQLTNTSISASCQRRMKSGSSATWVEENG